MKMSKKIEKAVIKSIANSLNPPKSKSKPVTRVKSNPTITEVVSSAVAGVTRVEKKTSGSKTFDISSIEK